MNFLHCRYGHEVEDIKTILSWVGEVEGPFDDMGDEPYVIVLRFMEYAIPCSHSLGEDGYGDIMTFKTKEEAEEYYRKIKPFQGKELPIFTSPISNTISSPQS